MADVHPRRLVGALVLVQEAELRREGAGDREQDAEVQRHGAPVIGPPPASLEGLMDGFATGSRRPVLLVDVDGVVSVFGAVAADPAAVLATQVDGHPHLLSRRAGALLARLTRTFACVWCTGWEERAEEHLPGLLGLPGGWPHLPLGTGWKLEAIDAAFGADHALAWIDDVHGDAERAWATARPGPTRLVTTDPAVGLTEAHAWELETWAAARRSDV
jgi:hypothetical protein